MVFASRARVSCSAFAFVLACSGDSAKDVGAARAGAGAPSVAGQSGAAGTGTAPPAVPSAGAPAAGTPSSAGTSGSPAAGRSGSSGDSSAQPTAGRPAVQPDDPTDAGADTDPRDAGADSSTDNGFDFPPLATSGAPLQAMAGRWSYVEFPDTTCRDGSPAGVYVNLGSAKKLMITLEGGGRCVEASTCSANFASVTAGDAVRAILSGGILDRSNRDNPVRDWNFVHVPYCTGDRHAGANPDASVPGVGPQKLVGYLNMKRFLDRVVPTFKDATDVLVTGVSAGGAGASFTAVLVQRAFQNVKVKTIIDSGAFVSKAVYAECDQRRMRTLLKAEQTFLADCGAACPNPDDYSSDFGVFLARALADRPSGLISSTGDATMRSFYSIGQNDCTGTLDLLNPTISAADFRKDLLAFREKIRGLPAFGTFYPEGEQHTFLLYPEFYTARAGDVRLVDWFTKIVNGQNAGHAGP